MGHIVYIWTKWTHCTKTAGFCSVVILISFVYAFSAYFKCVGFIESGWILRVETAKNARNLEIV